MGDANLHSSSKSDILFTLQSEYKSKSIRKID